MPLDIVISLLVLSYIHANYFLSSILMSLPYRFEEKRPRRFPKVSVIIPTKDEENVIEQTLKALRKSDYSKLEIIVVDASSDSTARIARKYAKVITDRKLTTKPQALNLALKHAKGEVLYFADADTLVGRSTIRKLVSQLSEETPAAVGICVPKNKNGLTARIARLQLAFLYALPFVSLRITKTTLIPGRNFAIYKKTINEIGGFRDVLIEDINFSLRLYNKGKKIVVVPAYAYEQVPRRLSWYMKQQERWLWGGICELKHLFSISSLFRSLTLVPAGIVLMYMPIVALLLLIAIALTKSLFFLSAVALAFALAAIAAIRLLDLDDVLLLPITFVGLSMLHFLILLNAFRKFLTGKRIEWHKTPKERL